MLKPADELSNSPSGKRSGKATRNLGGWILLWAILFTVILAPFLLFEAQVTSGLDAAFETLRARPWLGAGLIILLLGGDSILPVPSSIVSAFAGGVFGWTLGTLVIFTGMMIGALLGYALGASAGRVLAINLVGERAVQRARDRFADLGPAAIIIARAVPVLAEMSVLAAGAARMPLIPFLAATGLANAGVAAAYAATGAAAASSGMFLFVFIGLAAVPALGWAAWRIYRTRRARKPS